MKMYDKEKQCLVFFNEKATADFWGRYWDEYNLKQTVERDKDNRFYLSTLQTYIPDKVGRLIEGGCGLGRLVYCMHMNGYKCVGIDFSEKTIERIKETFNELDVMIGDVKKLPFTDDYFVGYWSIGVIEHFWVGYHDIISEMRRVLVKNGYVFLQVPYMSFLRKLKAKFGFYKEYKKCSVEPEDFYQFALNAKTLTKDFEAAGFKLVASRPRVGMEGFIEEVNIFEHQGKRLFLYSGRNLLIKGFRYFLNLILTPFAGHTKFFVFQKE